MGLRLLVFLALVSVADAHPYWRPPPPPPPTHVVARYVRTVGGFLDRVDRTSIARFLTGSTWDGPKGRIRFVDATAGQFAKPPGGVRNVLIREIERTRAGISVAIDGAMFVLHSCGNRACLELGGGGFGGVTYGG